MSQNMFDLAGWSEVTCEESNRVRENGDLGVTPVSSLTDMDGEFGTPTVYTEWADKVTGTPVLRDYCYPFGGTCEHYVPILGARR